MTQATGSFDKAVALAIETLQAQGFGVLAGTDVKKEMMKMPDVEGRSCRILKASTPPLAHREQTVDSNIVMLPPHDVFVREEADGHIAVGLMNPVAVLQRSDNLSYGEIVPSVRGRLERAHDKLVVS